MLNIKLSAGTRRTIVVNEEQTVADVLTQENVNTTGATISLDGAVLTADEQNSTFEELGAVEGSVLAAVVKADSAK